MKINLNARVRVTFTADGLSAMARRMTAREWHLHAINPTGEWVGQLWELFSMIGPHISMGRKPFIEDNDFEIVAP